MTNRFSSWMADSTVFAKPFNVASPIHARPVCIHPREDPILPRVTNDISSNVCDLHAVNSISSHHVFESRGGTVANKLCWVTASASKSCAPMQGSNPRLKYGVPPSAAPRAEVHPGRHLWAEAPHPSAFSIRHHGHARPPSLHREAMDHSRSLWQVLAEVSGNVGKFNPDAAKGYCKFFSGDTKFCGIDHPH